MKPFSTDNKFGKFVMSIIQGYSHDKYWKRYFILTNPDNCVSIFRKLYYLWYIKKVDARHNSSFGANLNKGAVFLAPPNLPHGPNGIIVGHDVKIGKNCTIFHQVTIASGDVYIGDNVIIGAGAKILSNVKIGDNVKIGANAVVVEDVPDNATVVLQKPRILLRN